MGISAPQKIFTPPPPRRRIPRRHPPGPLARPPFLLPDPPPPPGIFNEKPTPPPPGASNSPFPSPKQKKIEKIRNIHQVKDISIPTKRVTRFPYALSGYALCTLPTFWSFPALFPRARATPGKSEKLRKKGFLFSFRTSDLLDLLEASILPVLPFLVLGRKRQGKPQKKTRIFLSPPNP